MGILEGHPKNRKTTAGGQFKDSNDWWNRVQHVLLPVSAGFFRERIVCKDGQLGFEGANGLAVHRKSAAENPWLIDVLTKMLVKAS